MLTINLAILSRQNRQAQLRRMRAAKHLEANNFETYLKSIYLITGQFEWGKDLGGWGYN